MACSIVKIITSRSKNLLSAALLLSFLVSACGGGKDTEAARAKPISVKLKTLEITTLIDSSEYVGTLAAQDRVSLAPRIDGRILEIFVQQGDRVSQGDSIIRLEPTQEQENVNAAVQTVNVEKARLGQTQAQLSTAEANRAAAAAEVERAKADLQDLEAEVELAQINIERTKMLVEGGAQSRQDLDARTRDLKTAIAQRNSRKESLNATIESLQAAEKQVEQGRANIDSQNAAVARAEAELGSTRQNLAYNTIKAPINGVVGSFDQRKVGDYVNVGEQLTTITNNKTFDLNINIPTEYGSQLRLGLPVEIVNEDDSKGVTGEITYIAPLVEQNTQSILTKVTFLNDGSLRDREYIRVRVNWSRKPGVLVPTTAVSTLGGERFVFVAKKEESQEGEESLVAEQQPIKVGSIQAQDYQVLSGIKEGDKIVVSNILSLQDGTPITPANEESVSSKQTVDQ